jgi:hypothetical protein
VPRIEGFEISPGVFLPLLVVSLSMNGKTISEMGLVDSGADHTMVPSAWVESCGVSYASLGEEFTGAGAGGGYQYKLGTGTIDYGGKPFSTEFQVAAPKCGLPGPLLGRNDFFKGYVVRFAWHRTPPDFNVDPVGAKSKKARG